MPGSTNQPSRVIRGDAAKPCGTNTKRYVYSQICYAPTHPLSTAVGGSSVQEDGSEIANLSRDHIELLLKDTNDISRLLRKWQSQQTEEAFRVPWTEDDKLRKRISDLIESEADYVRVSVGFHQVYNYIQL